MRFDEISAKIAVIIPALNEEHAIGKVLNDIPKVQNLFIFVADNGSVDNTAKKAKEIGAFVVEESRRGYGWACLAGMKIAGKYNPEIVVFLDADYSDYPDEMLSLIKPILQDEVDFVVGSRVKGVREKGALLPQARFGNWLASFLINLFWGFKYTDLGPFRAIKWQALKVLNMQDKTFGWTVEMQIKALKHDLKITEVPVKYRKRIGASKVTGTLSGTIKAGYKILWTIFKFKFFA